MMVQEQLECGEECTGDYFQEGLPQDMTMMMEIAILLMKLDGRKLHGRMWNVQLGYCRASGGYWQVLWRCGMSYVFRTWLFHALSCTR